MVSCIDPRVETLAYQAEVLRTSGAGLDEAGRALPEEDLRSPCTEEIAVARVVAEGEQELVVIDTSVSDPVLRARRSREARYLDEVRALSRHHAAVPWLARKNSSSRLELGVAPTPEPISVSTTA